MSIRKHSIAALGLLIAAWAMASSALAVTPADTQLTSEATLTYSGNSTGIKDSVTVTVKLVPAAVSLVGPAINTSINKAEHQSYTETYTVQSNANGYDTYTVAATSTTNDVVGSDSPVTSVATLALGATAAAADVTSSATISVPSDGVSDSAINGLAAGDTVVVGGNTYTISSITDNASGNSTIVLNSAVTITTGTGIYEYKTFTTTIGDVGAKGASNNTLNVFTTVTSDTDPLAVFSQQVDITIVAISIQKFVRDTSGTCATGCSGSTINPNNSETYYSSGLKAEPGATLEYLLVVTTASSAGISNAVLADVLPQFTSYVASSTKLNGIAVNDETSGVAFPLDSSADDGGLLLDDNSSRASGTEGTGTIPLNTTVYVTYQVQVAN